MELYPLTFEPRLVPKIWGGRKLADLLGKALPEGQAIGESWELCDRPEFSSLVAQGPLKGSSLHQIFQEYGPHLIGNRLYQKGWERFPLMVKFIDAGDDLSVQVHPDDDYAASHVGPDEPGKTEMWVVYQADEGAQVVAGLKPGAERAQFVEALKQGRLETALNRFAVREGDCIFVPAGRVHALGKGCLVAEVQQNSDTTYRVYDYNRLENGKPRALHVQNALETIRFDAAFNSLPNVQDGFLVQADDYQRQNVADCAYFKVEKVFVRFGFQPSQQEDSFHILLGKKGSGSLKWKGGQLTLKPGQTVLVPASVTWRLKPEQPEKGMEVVWTRI